MKQFSTLVNHFIQLASLAAGSLSKITCPNGNQWWPKFVKRSRFHGSHSGYLAECCRKFFHKYLVLRPTATFASYFYRCLFSQIWDFDIASFCLFLVC